MEKVMRHISLASLIFFMACSLPVQADDEGRDAVDDVPGSRAVLGINIANGARHRGEVDGVLVVGVTPGGPADSAGIQPDDIILSINGIKLAAHSARRANRKLLGFMRTVEPGDELKVVYRRGDEQQDATFEAGELTADMMPHPERFARMLERWDGKMPRMDGLPFEFRWRHYGVFSGMELVELTPRLGHYFNTEKGLLVVRAPDDAQLKLEDGDVISKIGGRVPRSPDHAMRILRSYAPGESLDLEIVRDKRKRSLSITLPQADPQSFLGNPRRRFRGSPDRLHPVGPQPNHGPRHPSFGART